MVGERRQCNADYTFPPFWKNSEYEYGGAFFSVQYAGQENLYEGLAVWKENNYREIQGTYPVISLSFANVKENNYQTARKKICQLLANLYTQNAFLLDSGILHETDINYFKRVAENMDDADATLALYQLSSFLYRYYGKEKEKVKRWYDGFVFGSHRDIYNPWSVLNFLDTGKCLAYWANTSSNSLAGKLIREGDRQIKTDFEELLRGGCLMCPVDEQIVYDQLDHNDSAIWSLLLASGYLKVLDYEREDMIEEDREPLYSLTLTNYEVKRMFDNMVRGWFREI